MSSFKIRCAVMMFCVLAGVATVSRPLLAQKPLTDGWSLWTSPNGTTYEIPPGYEPIQLPDGTIWIGKVGEQPPPPPQPEPDVKLANASGVFHLASFQQSPYSPGLRAAPHSAFARGGPIKERGARFGEANRASLNVLRDLDLVEPHALARLEGDIRQVHSRLLELVADGHLNSRSFGTLRQSSFRIRRTLVDVIPRLADQPNSVRRADAVRMLDGMVRQMEVLLPMLDEMERASQIQ